MCLKLLLTADVHLGLKFSNYPEVQQELSEARFNTLKNIVELANEQKCDLFVVAGDLFDHQRVSERDIVRTAQIINEFQGKLAVILPGNHDFIIPNDSRLWQKFKSQKGDRVLLLEECKVYQLNHYDLDMNLYSAPCQSKHSSTNNVGWIKNISKESAVKYHIGIAHGSLQDVSPDPDKRFYPMTKDELLNCGLDIWLMGHTDRIQYPPKSSSFDRIFYPGTPEPNGFDCQHEGKVWVITLDEEKKISASSVVTGNHRFIQEKIKLTSSEDAQALVNKYSPEINSKNLLKLKLTGRIPKKDFSTLFEILEGLKTKLLYVEYNTDELRQEITIETINKEFTEGSFPHKLLYHLSENADDYETLQLAYNLIQEVRK
ncbi:MAG: DNA repair exonuclease [Bacteroidota bacterium]|nr:DNA repair exonuclease [Bacteroidota bacterium]